MDKISMREWLAALEEMIDNKLRKWRKHAMIQNGESVKLRWQFETTDIIIDVFWEDAQELVVLRYLHPRNQYEFKWHGLTNVTFNKIQDRIGNLSMQAMHPPIDPEVDLG